MGHTIHSSSMAALSSATQPQVQSTPEPPPWMPTVPPSAVFHGGALRSRSVRAMRWISDGSRWCARASIAFGNEMPRKRW